MGSEGSSHIAIFLWPISGPHNQLLLGPHTIYSAVSEQQTNNPDGFFIIAGDFNHANLKTVLPKFYQHVNFATRGNNTLDFVYTTEKNAYKAEPRPHLGYSDHISVMLIPAYRPLLKLAKPVALKNHFALCAAFHKISLLHNNLMYKIYFFAQFHVQISLLHNFINIYIKYLCKVFVQSQFVYV